ncbi:MAG TPA: pyrimidine 5'-nucleotidase [Asticcacaulis sp.]|nr:pyrimidine 5'-nucleotidase [Asticcacaulis sp.]
MPTLAHITTWLFDLDNTLYPPEAEVMALIVGKMTDFVARETGLSHDEAFQLQKRYLHEHGTTLAGLMAHHGVEPRRFLDEVHDVSIDSLHPDPELNALLARLEGRRIVFTNSDERHAVRMLQKLEMNHLFDGLFHLEHANYVPKPQAATFELMMKAHVVTPADTAFFEDTARNLEPAKTLGMTTVLVGPKAADNTDDFVDFRSPSLKAFLAECLQT